jgi:hypothetical protein
VADREHRQSSLARWSRVGFVVSAWLFAAGVALQVFLAGLSTFDNPARWADHVSFGQWIGTFTILLVLFSLTGRLPRELIGLSVIVLLLYGLQFSFANIDNGPIAALHALNALALFWLSVHLAQRGWPLLARRAGARSEGIV